MVCFGILVGEWFAMSRLAYSGRGDAPCSLPGGDRFDPNPLDDEERYPANDLAMPADPLTVMMT